MSLVEPGILHPAGNLLQLVFHPFRYTRVAPAIDGEKYRI